jgi:hypothetical protein
MFRLGVAILVVTALSGVFTAPAFAQAQVCEPVGQEIKIVIQGVTLTWDSPFWCDNVPDTGDYEIRITITNHAGSAEVVRIDDLRLSRTTPRPRRQAPAATAVVSGLPMVIAPGESGSFSVRGTYTLVLTGEGKKANLHFRAIGQGITSAAPFRLGINVHLRGPGAVEGKAESGGPPPWVGGPPLWAGGPPPGVRRP